MARSPVEGTDGLRDDLVARVDAMGRLADHPRRGALAAELEAFRRVAIRHGIGPALTVVHALDTALARGERGPRIHGGLAILRDAVGCGVNDAQTCDTFAAICTVRLSG